MPTPTSYSRLNSPRQGAQRKLILSSVLLVKKENQSKQMNADLAALICSNHFANAALLLLSDLGGRLLRVAPVVENADLMNAL